jgi:hypothetical protein
LYPLWEQIQLLSGWPILRRFSSEVLAGAYSAGSWVTLTKPTIYDRSLA